MPCGSDLESRPQKMDLPVTVYAYNVYYVK